MQDKNHLAIATAAERGFALEGAPGMLQEMLRLHQPLYSSRQVDAYELATTYCLLGDKQHALDLLQLSVQKREARVVAMRIDQNFDSLHDEPLFRALLAKVGLPPLS